MNTLELADELEERFAPYCDEAATMLRQQQADLKDADKYALELERLYEDAKAEIEALKKVLQEVVRISDRNHDAWNKAEELLK